MLWLNSSRERIKSENPGISITEISKKAGEMWRQLGKDEKEVRREKNNRCFQCHRLHHFNFYLSAKQNVFCPLKFLCFTLYFLFSFRSGKQRQGRPKGSMIKQRRSTKRAVEGRPLSPRSKAHITRRPHISLCLYTDALSLSSSPLTH